jgi:hypothetical protein
MTKSDDISIGWVSRIKVRAVWMGEVEDDVTEGEVEQNSFEERPGGIPRAL